MNQLFPLLFHFFTFQLSLELYTIFVFKSSKNQNFTSAKAEVGVAPLAVRYREIPMNRDEALHCRGPDKAGWSPKGRDGMPKNRHKLRPSPTGRQSLRGCVATLILAILSKMVVAPIHRSVIIFYYLFAG